MHRRADPSYDPIDRLIELRKRVRAGDADAMEEIADHLLRVLRPAIRGLFPRAPRDLIESAIEDAILKYLQDPHDSGSSNEFRIEALVVYAARRNVLNLLQGEQRRRAREGRWAEEQGERLPTVVSSICKPTGTQRSCQSR